MLNINPREVEMNLNHNMKIISAANCPFNIHYWGVVPNHKSNMIHKHSFFEVCYIIKGEGIYIENGIEHNLEPNTIFISLPYTNHYIINKPGLYITYVGFGINTQNATDEFTELVNSILCTDKVIRYSMEETSIALLWKSVLYQANTTLCNIEVLQAQCHALLINIIDVFNDKIDSKTQKNSIKQKEHSHFNRAKLFIQDNLTNPLSLSDLAYYLHISKRQLTRVFKSESGTSFNRYLQKQRIYLAAELLSTTDIPIKDIASQSGFSTVHYFTKVFTRFLGRTPGEYRKKSTDKDM